MTTKTKIPDVPKSTLLNSKEIHDDAWQTFLEGLHDEDLLKIRQAAPFRGAKDLAVVREIRAAIEKIKSFEPLPKVQKAIRSAKAAAEANREQIALLMAKQSKLDATVSGLQDAASRRSMVEDGLCWLAFRNRHIGALLRDEIQTTGLKVCPKKGCVLDGQGKARAMGEPNPSPPPKAEPEQEAPEPPDSYWAQQTNVEGKN